MANFFKIQETPKAEDVIFFMVGLINVKKYCVKFEK